MAFPPLILGCSTFGYGIYADDDNVQSSMPLRVVRLALRSGMNAFDTCERFIIPPSVVRN